MSKNRSPLDRPPVPKWYHPSNKPPAPDVLKMHRETKEFKQAQKVFTRGLLKKDTMIDTEADPVELGCFNTRNEAHIELSRFFVHLPTDEQTRQDFMATAFDCVVDYCGPIESCLTIQEQKAWIKKVRQAVESTQLALAAGLSEKDDDNLSIIPKLTLCINEAIRLVVRANNQLPLEESEKEHKQVKSPKTGQTKQIRIRPKATHIGTQTPPPLTGEVAFHANAINIKTLLDDMQESSKNKPATPRAPQSVESTRLSEEPVIADISSTTQTQPETKETTMSNTNAAETIKNTTNDAADTISARAHQAAAAVSSAASKVAGSATTAAHSIQNKVESPSFWAKAKTSLKWTAGIAAIGGVGYFIYTKIKSGDVENLTHEVTEAAQVAAAFFE